MRKTLRLFVVVLMLMAGGCQTSDSTLRNEGRSEAYIQGFHDGRHSGLSEEGNAYEHFIRDEARFADDAEYRSGWLAGETEGKQLQVQATTIGEAAAGAYSGAEIGKEVKKDTDADAIARDAVEGMDTSGLESL